MCGWRSQSIYRIKVEGPIVIKGRKSFCVDQHFAFWGWITTTTGPREKRPSDNRCVCVCPLEGNLGDPIERMKTLFSESDPSARFPIFGPAGERERKRETRACYQLLGRRRRSLSSPARHYCLGPDYIRL
jgi:hypothetical protein